MTVAEKAKELEFKYGVKFNLYDEVEDLKERVSIIKDMVDLHDKLLEDITKLIEYLKNN